MFSQSIRTRKRSFRGESGGGVSGGEIVKGGGGFRRLILWACVLLLGLPLMGRAAEHDAGVLMWRQLDRLQGTVSRGEFLSAVQRVYSPSGAFLEYVEIDAGGATVYSDKEHTRRLWRLEFSDAPGRDMPYRFDPELVKEFEPEEKRVASFEKPLEGLTICLDPGHIGGDWANIEERYFRIRKDPPVKEGELNLTVCELLAPMLEEAGARVVWTKRDFQPVTHKRPFMLMEEGIELFRHHHADRIEEFLKSSRKHDKLVNQSMWRAEFIFYRAYEIAARAQKVNRLRPDFTVCVHFNAAPWRGRRPYLSSRTKSKTVVFVHGAYMDEELESDEHKFHLMRKLLEKSSEREVALGTSVAEQLRLFWGWPPENYQGSGYAHRVNGHPYVWARNLMANRMFDGPTVFIEGPYMNDPRVYPRLQAGDYEGLREIRGLPQRSVFREFAEIIAEGIILHYRGAGQEDRTDGVD